MVEIASALQDRPHITNIVEAVSQELTALPTDPILMFIIDSAPTEALYYLASQYGVLGWGGWRLANTEQQRRNLIKTAVKLQRTKGTPASIKNAIATLGYDSVTITTSIGIFFDGSYDHDGEITYNGGNWATFNVTINVANGVTIPDATLDQIKALINEYKNARSILNDLLVNELEA